MTENLVISEAQHHGHEDLNLPHEFARQGNYDKHISLYGFAHSSKIRFFIIIDCLSYTLKIKKTIKYSFAKTLNDARLDFGRQVVTPRVSIIS